MILTDDILLQIFVFYRHAHSDVLWEWHILVHVCRRWRQIVFESPRFLDLKIRCTTNTPVKEKLSIWPAFPIAIDFRSTFFDSIPSDAIVAFEDTGRIGYLKLDLTELRPRPWSQTFATLISKPFPVLTHLIIHIPVEVRLAPRLPDDFLGGSAPRLQIFHLHNVAFPALQTLLLSASDLVELRLQKIPRADVISPLEMAWCLAELPRLKTLVLQFQSEFPPHHDTPVHPPQVPVTRPVLPALTDLEFTGPSYYLQGIVAHIDCPWLNQITISYMSSPRNFQFEQLFEFFNRTMPPFGHVKVYGHSRVTFDLYHHTNRTDWYSHPATTVISCRPIMWRLFDLLIDFSVILSTVVDLKFVGKFWARNSLSGWLPFLHQLPVLQTLYVTLPHAQDLAHALISVKGEEVAQTLPCLELIGLENPASSIEEFVAVRQLSGRPLTVVGTEAEFDQRRTGTRI